MPEEEREDDRDRSILSAHRLHRRTCYLESGQEQEMARRNPLYHRPASISPQALQVEIKAEHGKKTGDYDT